MGIGIPGELGEADASFTSAIVDIEEFAKIDPSVSVLCDVQNTLVNSVFQKYGTKEQQDNGYLSQRPTSWQASASANRERKLRICATGRGRKRR